MIIIPSEYCSNTIAAVIFVSEGTLLLLYDLRYNGDVVVLLHLFWCQLTSYSYYEMMSTGDLDWHYYHTTTIPYDLRYNGDVVVLLH